jgi:hypothetical protein
MYEKKTSKNKETDKDNEQMKQKMMTRNKRKEKYVLLILIFNASKYISLAFFFKVFLVGGIEFSYMLNIISF